MSSGMWGANVEDLEQLGTLFHERGRQLRETHPTVRGYLARVPWEGGDASMHLATWDGVQRSQLMAVAAALEEMGSELLVHAREQRQASSVGGIGSGPAYPGGSSGGGGGGGGAWPSHDTHGMSEEEIQDLIADLERSGELSELAWSMAFHGTPLGAVGRLALTAHYAETYGWSDHRTQKSILDLAGSTIVTAKLGPLGAPVWFGLSTGATYTGEVVLPNYWTLSRYGVTFGEMNDAMANGEQWAVDANNEFGTRSGMQLVGDFAPLLSPKTALPTLGYQIIRNRWF